MHIVFGQNDTNEAFHMHFDIRNDFVSRWGMLDNVTQERVGSPEDGTTIDFDEPFLLRFAKIIVLYLLLIVTQNNDRIECDEDGWTLKVNDESKTDSFLHIMSPTLINYVKIRGHSISISYVGFGGAGENNPSTHQIFN